MGFVWSALIAGLQWLLRALLTPKAAPAPIPVESAPEAILGVQSKELSDAQKADDARAAVDADSLRDPEKLRDPDPDSRD